VSVFDSKPSTIEAAEKQKMWRRAEKKTWQKIRSREEISAVIYCHSARAEGWIKNRRHRETKCRLTLFVAIDRCYLMVLVGGNDLRSH